MAARGTRVRLASGFVPLNFSPSGAVRSPRGTRDAFHGDDVNTMSNGPTKRKTRAGRIAGQRLRPAPAARRSGPAGQTTFCSPDRTTLLESFIL